MDLNLDGRVVLVTGATRGIGREIARSAAREGAVVVVLSRNGGDCEAMAGALGPGRSSWVQCDVGKEDEVKRAMAEILDRHGRLDAIVNNAGRRLSGAPLIDIPFAMIREGFDTKVIGALGLIQAALPALRQSDQPRIVNISGVTAQRIMPGTGATSLANSAMISLTAYLARELSADKINVNCIIPGYVLTGPWRERVEALATEEGLDFDTAAQEILKRGDMGHSRWGADYEIADVVVFLLSRQAAFVNGASFRVDGGQFLSIQR